MKRKLIPPYVVIDGEYNYTGLVIALLESFKKYPNRFRPQHIPEEYKENPSDLLDGTIVDYMEGNKTLAIIKKTGNIGGVIPFRTISFPVKGARYVIGNFVELCKRRGCTVYDSSTSQSDTEPPQEIVAGLVDDLKAVAPLVESFGIALKNVEEDRLLIENALPSGTGSYKDDKKETEH